MAPPLGRQDGIIRIEQNAKLLHAPPLSVGGLTNVQGPHSFLRQKPD